MVKGRYFKSEGKALKVRNAASASVTAKSGEDCKDEESAFL